MTEAVLKGTIDLAVLLGFPGGTLPLRWYPAPTRPLPQRGRSLSLFAYREPCGMRQRALQRLAEAGHQVEVTAESTSLEGVIGVPLATRSDLDALLRYVRVLRPPRGAHPRRGQRAHVGQPRRGRHVPVPGPAA